MNILDENIYDDFVTFYNDLDDDNFWVNSVSVRCLKYFQKFGEFVESRGRNRLTLIFKNRNIVVKIPVNCFGIEDNYYEARKTNVDKDWLNKLARTKLVELPKMGLPILIMEKVDIDLKDKPDWANYIDCGQVGLTKRGKIKAYDFGIY